MNNKNGHLGAGLRTGIQVIPYDSHLPDPGKQWKDLVGIGAEQAAVPGPFPRPCCATESVMLGINNI